MEVSLIVKLFSVLSKKDEHQEIKTVINHEDPNCKSHKKLKKYLEIIVGVFFKEKYLLMKERKKLMHIN